MFTIIEYAASIASNCWPRPDGGSTWKPGPEHAPAARARHSAIVRPGFTREVDAVERAAAPEHLLRGVDVHDREVAAERARQARRLHDAADGELPRRPRPCRAAAGCPTARRLLLGELLRDDDRVGLREEHQRVVDDRFVAALEVVVAQAAVAGHVDAEDEQVALPLDVRCRRPLRSPAPRRGPSAPPARVSSTSSPKPGLAGRHLQLGLARDAIDRAARTRRARSGSPCACRRTPRRRARCPAVVSIVRRTCLRKYGQLMSRSRIIGARPRRCGRRAARSCARSSRPPSCRA